MESMPRPRLQRSLSERPAPLRRSSSLYGLLSRVPTFRNGWGVEDMDDYCSSAEDEPIAPPSPTVSPEEAKRVRKQKLQRLFKLGVSKVMKERAMEMNKTAHLASLYALDAFAGRLQHGMAAMSARPWYIFAAFRWQISSQWLWCIIVCSLAHSMLVFLEPGPRDTGRDGWLGEGTLRALEALFIAVYAMDVGLKVAYMGLKNYLKKPWQKLMIGIVLTLAVDASGLFAVRFARFLRPAILSLRTRSIRRFYAVVSNMLPGFLRVCLPVLFFLLLSASFAALTFGRAKSEFENSMSAGYAIWILMVSADNYASLVDDPSQHPTYIPFVVMVIIVGSMFLLSLLLGVTYDVFIEHTTDQVKNERLKELRGLNKAFATMDPEGTGKLSMVVWDRFLQHMMPRTTQQERALYFEIASGFGDELDVLGFMELRQVLSYRFVNVNAVERQGNRLKWEQKPPWLVWLLETMEGFLSAKWWKHTVAAVVLLDCLFLPYGIPHQGPGLHITRLTTACGVVLLLDQAFRWAEWMRQGSGPGPLRLPGKSFHTKVAGIAVLAHTAVVAVLYCPPLMARTCSAASSASAAWSSVLSSLSHKSDGMLHDLHNPDGAGGGLGESGWGGAGGDGSAERLGWCPVKEGYDGGRGGGAGEGVCLETDWCTDGMLMLAYTMRLLRCWRLVTLNDTLHAHVDTFFSVVPVFAQTLSFAFIVAYAFAMSGMQFFADKASAFKDAGTSLKTTLQLFVGVDFSAVVEDTVSEVGPSAFLYFALYHVVGVLIVFNLLTAIMIQLYGEALNEKSRQNLEDQRKADQLLQDSLYEHNTKQSVLRLWGRNLTQRAAKLNITRATQVNTGREARRVLGSAKSHIFTEEELTACQSYAKVDLLRAWQEKSRGDSSLRSFERSLYQKLKSNNALNNHKFKDGEVIIQRGDQHHCCYFVHKGAVRLEALDGTIETKETGEMFGEEALVAGLPACTTATAEGPVECMAIDRASFTETHGTLENLGHILLRLQRSGSFSGIEAPPSDVSSGRRSAFSQGGGGGGSGRGFRMGHPALFRSGDLDGSGVELRSERWRASSRNFAALQHHRSSRNNWDESTGISARDRTDSWRRRENSGGSDRSGGGRQRVPSVSSSRGDSFARGSSGRTDAFSRANSVMQKEEAAVSATGDGSASAAPAVADAGGGARNPEIASEQKQEQHHRQKVLKLFGDEHTLAAEAGPKAGAPPSGASASEAAAALQITGVESIRFGHGAPVAVDSLARGDTIAASAGAEATTATEEQGFRATLRRDYGRVQMLVGAEELEKGQGDGEERMEVEPSLCKDLGRDSDNWAAVGSPVSAREGVTDEDGRQKKNADLIIPAMAAADSDVMDRRPLERDGGEFQSADTASDGNSEAYATAGSSGRETGRLEASGGGEGPGSTRTNSTNDNNDNSDPGVAYPMMPSSMRVGGRGRSDALCPERWQFHRIIHESNYEQGTSSGRTMAEESRPETAAAGLDAGAKSSSLEYSECDDDIGSPELSPSAAPPNRRQGSLLMSSAGPFSRSSRRESEKIAGGSAMSTWSTNSPSPVLTTDGVVDGADAE